MSKQILILPGDGIGPEIMAEAVKVLELANDKYSLYPRIVKNADMQIVNIFKRPVLNRTEKDKTPYSEFIFHIRG